MADAVAMGATSLAAGPPMKLAGRTARNNEWVE